MLLLPTMGRPEKARRFIEAYRATGGTLPCWIVLDGADAHRYDGLELPGRWRRIVVAAGTKPGEILNQLFAEHPNDPYYAATADDVVPETPGWDVKLRDACLPDKVAWGYDGIENMGSHPFIGGDLLRKLGWWVAPGLKRSCIDGVWNIIAAKLGRGVYLPDVRTIHHHHTNQKAAFDATYAARADSPDDVAVFRAFLANGLPAALERAKP
ncbi:MAG TPA: hypothetical protein VHW09_26845 [Bryobacteraceae bacterium]|jgi:hypothetical protein|nr:hypothetical protein [Bryobacteraceae bacterium]